MTDQPVTYTPQFQPPGWQDNVDLVWFEGPNGFDAQFKSLRNELDMLSSVVKQLSDQISSVSQTLSNQINSVSQIANTANATANTANSAATKAQTTAETANSAANAAQTTANSAQNTAKTANSTANVAQTTANRAIQAANWRDIRADGTVVSSSGNFTVTKPGTGLYDIIFNTAFSSIPAVQATQIFPWGDPNSQPTIRPTGPITSPGMMTTDNAVVVGITESQCRIKTGDGGGNASDRPFSFIAYCPPTA